MKFLNKGKNCKVRLENPKAEDSGRYIWKTLKTNEVIDLPKEAGIKYGFEEVVITQSNSKPEITKGKIGKIKVETKQLKKKENYQKEILSINGVGKKTMQDIIKVYPIKEELIKAIKDNNHIPFNDDIAKKLEKKYG